MTVHGDDNTARVLRSDMPEGASRPMRQVRIATIQPPAPGEAAAAQDIVRQGLALLEEALESRPDVVCLPEHFNCSDSRSHVDPRVFDCGARDVLAAVSKRTALAQCAAIVPVVIDEKGRRYNRAYVLDRTGQIVHYYDKVHVTQVERDQLRIEPGGDWPVFDLDFGRIGVMICYDGCFTEPARILALAGAEIIFWPSMQRAYTKDQLELQTRAHALFNYSVVVRSSYGGTICGAGSRVPVVGFSSICAASGEILASIESRAGWLAASVDLEGGPRGWRSFGGEIGQLRDMRLDDRRPHTYQCIVTSVPAPNRPHRGAASHEHPIGARFSTGPDGL